MALLVWLPLNGNIKNLGLSNLKFSLSGSGITTDSAGKIGSCYKRASIRSGGRIASNTTINLNGSISMFCWAKVTACVGDTANGLVSNHSHANNTGFGITVKLVSASDFRISCSTGNGSGRTYMTYYGTTNIKDKWCHLGLTYNKTSNTLKLWVNGSCEYTGTYTNSSIADYIWIFDWSTTYSDVAYLPACYLNDVRIYDHCLSEDEIHELSLSKVAHWPLNEDPVNKYNLPTLDYGSAKWACLLVHNNPASNLFANDSAGGCYGKYGDNLYSRLHLLTGNSFKTSGGVIEFLVVLKAKSSNGDSYYRWTQTVNPIDTGASSSSCTSATVGFTNVSNAPYGLCKRNNYSYFTGTGLGSSWWGAIGCYTAYSGGIPGFASVIVKSGYLKLYVRIDNLPKEKCYDISGNHNDLTCNGINIISYSDTKRYDKSIRLQAQNVNTGYLQTNTGISAITNGSVSFWAKVINKGNSGWLPFTGLSGGYYIMAWNNGGNFYHLTIGNNTKIIYCDGLVTTTFPNDTNWHYYVMTGINLSSWTTFKINNYGNTWNSDVAYSDVRLYATVLSADDVLKLYKLGNV